MKCPYCGNGTSKNAKFCPSCGKMLYSYDSQGLQQEKVPTFIGYRILIIILSLIPLFSGLGLIIAGIKGKQKKWTAFGVGYILGEFLLSLTVVGAIVASFLYILSIIHTVIIGSKFVEILRNENQQMLYGQQGIQLYKTTPEEKYNWAEKINNEPETNEVQAEDVSGVDIVDMPILIGKATIKGDTNDDLKIAITDESGKIYRFLTKGNMVISFQKNDGSEYCYHEV